MSFSEVNQITQQKYGFPVNHFDLPDMDVKILGKVHFKVDENHTSPPYSEVIMHKGFKNAEDIAEKFSQVFAKYNEVEFNGKKYKAVSLDVKPHQNEGFSDISTLVFVMGKIIVAPATNTPQNEGMISYLRKMTNFW